VQRGPGWVGGEPGLVLGAAAERMVQRQRDIAGN
jgi:hypothetical protein